MTDYKAIVYLPAHALPAILAPCAHELMQINGCAISGPVRVAVTLYRDGDWPDLGQVVGAVLDTAVGAWLHDLDQVKELVPNVKACVAGARPSITVSVVLLDAIEALQAREGE